MTGSSGVPNSPHVGICGGLSLHRELSAKGVHQSVIAPPLAPSRCFCSSPKRRCTTSEDFHHTHGKKKTKGSVREETMCPRPLGDFLQRGENNLMRLHHAHYVCQLLPVKETVLHGNQKKHECELCADTPSPESTMRHHIRIEEGQDRKPTQDSWRKKEKKNILQTMIDRWKNQE